MTPTCAACPCKDICLRRPDFCATAASPAPGELGEVQLRHICARSALGRDPSPTDYPAPAEYPSPARQAANLAGSFWAWATSGFRMASHEEQRRRMDICVLCENWDSAQGRCRLCGCYLSAKVSMKTEHCPMEPPKW